jgi:hypothetical protein
MMRKFLLLTLIFPYVTHHCGDIRHQIEGDQDVPSIPVIALEL